MFMLGLWVRPAILVSIICTIAMGGPITTDRNKEKNLDCNENIIKSLYGAFGNIPQPFDPKEELYLTEQDYNPSIICWTRYFTLIENAFGDVVDRISEYSVTFEKPKDIMQNYVQSVKTDNNGNLKTTYIEPEERVEEIGGYLIRKRKIVSCSLSTETNKLQFQNDQKIQPRQKFNSPDYRKSDEQDEPTFFETTTIKKKDYTEAEYIISTVSAGKELKKMYDNFHDKFEKLDTPHPIIVGLINDILNELQNHVIFQNNTPELINLFKKFFSLHSGNTTVPVQSIMDLFSKILNKIKNENLLDPKLVQFLENKESEKVETTTAYDDCIFNLFDILHEIAETKMYQGLIIQNKLKMYLKHNPELPSPNILCTIYNLLTALKNNDTPSLKDFIKKFYADLKILQSNNKLPISLQSITNEIIKLLNNLANKNTLKKDKPTSTEQTTTPQLNLGELIEHFNDSVNSSEITSPSYLIKIRNILNLLKPKDGSVTIIDNNKFKDQLSKLRSEVIYLHKKNINVPKSVIQIITSFLQIAKLAEKENYVTSSELPSANINTVTNKETSVTNENIKTSKLIHIKPTILPILVSKVTNDLKGITKFNLKIHNTSSTVSNKKIVTTEKNIKNSEIQLPKKPNFKTIFVPSTEKSKAAITLKKEITKLHNTSTISNKKIVTTEKNIKNSESQLPRKPNVETIFEPSATERSKPATTLKKEITKLHHNTSKRVTNKKTVTTEKNIKISKSKSQIHKEPILETTSVSTAKQTNKNISNLKESVTTDKIIKNSKSKSQLHRDSIFETTSVSTAKQTNKTISNLKESVTTEKIIKNSKNPFISKKPSSILSAITTEKHIKNAESTSKLYTELKTTKDNNNFFSQKINNLPTNSKMSHNNIPTQPIVETTSTPLKKRIRQSTPFSVNTKTSNPSLTKINNKKKEKTTKIVEKIVTTSKNVAQLNMSTTTQSSINVQSEIQHIPVVFIDGDKLDCMNVNKTVFVFNCNSVISKGYIRNLNGFPNYTDNQFVTNYDGNGIVVNSDTYCYALTPIHFIKCPENNDNTLTILIKNSTTESTNEVTNATTPDFTCESDNEDKPMDFIIRVEDWADLDNIKAKCYLNEKNVSVSKCPSNPIPENIPKIILLHVSPDTEVTSTKFNSYDVQPGQILAKDKDICYLIQTIEEIDCPEDDTPVMIVMSFINGYKIATVKINDTPKEVKKEQTIPIVKFSASTSVFVPKIVTLKSRTYSVPSYIYSSTSKINTVSEELQEKKEMTQATTTAPPLSTTDIFDEETCDESSSASTTDQENSSESINFKLHTIPIKYMDNNNTTCIIIDKNMLVISNTSLNNLDVPSVNDQLFPSDSKFYNISKLPHINNTMFLVKGLHSYYIFNIAKTIDCPADTTNFLPVRKNGPEQNDETYWKNTKKIQHSTTTSLPSDISISSEITEKQTELTTQNTEKEISTINIIETTPKLLSESTQHTDKEIIIDPAINSKNQEKEEEIDNADTSTATNLETEQENTFSTTLNVETESTQQTDEPNFTSKDATETQHRESDISNSYVSTTSNVNEVKHSEIQEEFTPSTITDIDVSTTLTVIDESSSKDVTQNYVTEEDQPRDTEINNLNVDTSPQPEQEITDEVITSTTKVNNDKYSTIQEEDFSTTFTTISTIKYDATTVANQQTEQEIDNAEINTTQNLIERTSLQTEPEIFITSTTSNINTGTESTQYGEKEITENKVTSTTNVNNDQHKEQEINNTDLSTSSNIDKETSSQTEQEILTTKVFSTSTISNIDENESSNDNILSTTNLIEESTTSISTSNIEAEYIDQNTLKDYAINPENQFKEQETSNTPSSKTEQEIQTEVFSTSSTTVEATSTQDTESEFSKSDIPNSVTTKKDRHREPKFSTVGNAFGKTNSFATQKIIFTTTPTILSSLITKSTKPKNKKVYTKKYTYTRIPFTTVKANNRLTPNIEKETSTRIENEISNAIFTNSPKEKTIYPKLQQELFSTSSTASPNIDTETTQYAEKELITTIDTISEKEPNVITELLTTKEDRDVPSIINSEEITNVPVSEISTIKPHTNAKPQTTTVITKYNSTPNENNASKIQEPLIVKHRTKSGMIRCYEIDHKVHVKLVPCPSDTSKVPRIVNPDIIKLICPKKFKNQTSNNSGSLGMLRRLHMVYDDSSSKELSPEAI